LARQFVTIRTATSPPYWTMIFTISRLHMHVLVFQSDLQLQQVNLPHSCFPSSIIIVVQFSMEQRGSVP